MFLRRTLFLFQVVSTAGAASMGGGAGIVGMRRLGVGLIAGSRCCRCTVGGIAQGRSQPSASSSIAIRMSMVGRVVMVVSGRSRLLWRGCCCCVTHTTPARRCISRVWMALFAGLLARVLLIKVSFFGRRGIATVGTTRPSILMIVVNRRMVVMIRFSLCLLLLCGHCSRRLPQGRIAVFHRRRRQHGRQDRRRIMIVMIGHLGRSPGGSRGGRGVGSGVVAHGFQALGHDQCVGRRSGG